MDIVFAGKLAPSRALEECPHLLSCFHNPDAQWKELAEWLKNNTVQDSCNNVYIHAKM